MIVSPRCRHLIPNSYIFSYAYVCPAHTPPNLVTVTGLHYMNVNCWTAGFLLKEWVNIMNTNNKPVPWKPNTMATKYRWSSVMLSIFQTPNLCLLGGVPWPSSLHGIASLPKRVLYLDFRQNSRSSTCCHLELASLACNNETNINSRTSGKGRGCKML